MKSDIARLWQPAGETGLPEVVLLESLDRFAKFVELVAHRDRASQAVTKSEVLLVQALAKGFREHASGPDFVLASGQLPDSRKLAKTNHVWASLASAYSNYAVSMQEEACNGDRLPVVCVVRCWSDERKGRGAEFQLWVECGGEAGSSEIWPELTLATPFRRVPQLQLFTAPESEEAESPTDASSSPQPISAFISSPASGDGERSANDPADATRSDAADGSGQDRTDGASAPRKAASDPAEDFERNYRMAKLLLEHQKKDSGVLTWITIVAVLIGIYLIWPPGLLGLGLQP